MEAVNLLRNVGNNLQAHITSYSGRFVINAAENLRSGVLFSYGRLIWEYSIDLTKGDSLHSAVL
jgi:hypothetical protein